MQSWAKKYTKYTFVYRILYFPIFFFNIFFFSTTFPYQPNLKKFKMLHNIRKFDIVLNISKKYINVNGKRVVYCIKSLNRKNVNFYFNKNHRKRFFLIFIQQSKLYCNAKCHWCMAVRIYFSIFYFQYIFFLNKKKAF